MEFSPSDKIASTKSLQSHGSHSSSSSFSSSSSSRSNSFSSIPPSPSSFPLSRVPFSWEHQPGIPKKSNHHSSGSKSTCSAMLLPLPPSAPGTCLRRLSLESAFRKKSSSNQGSLERDPFELALRECSKHVEVGQDNDNQEVDKYWNKMSRVLTLSDRFGFIDRYTSCKKSCAVTESLVLLPRSIRKS